MKFKKLQFNMGIFLVTFLCMIFFTSLFPARAEAEDVRKEFISNLKVEAGEGGEKTLIKKGYFVIYPAVKKASGDKAYIGYKTTDSESEAVKDVIFSENRGSITVKKKDSDISYSGIDTGLMISGKEMFLKYTKDSHAGEALMCLRFLSSAGAGDKGKNDNFDDVLPLANDGALTLKCENGKAAVLETDIYKVYGNLIKKDIFKPYVKKLYISKGDSKKGAVLRLVKKGAEMYVNNNLSREAGKWLLIGYEKTADKDKAISDIIAYPDKGADIKGYEIAFDENIDNNYLYFSREEKYGNPIHSLDFIKNFKDFRLKGDQWIELSYFSGSENFTKSYIQKNDDYKKIAGNSDQYVMAAIYSQKENDMGIIITSKEEGLKEKQEQRFEILNKSDVKDKDKNNVSGDITGDGENSSSQTEYIDSDDSSSESPNMDSSAADGTEENAGDNLTGADSENGDSSLTDDADSADGSGVVTDSVSEDSDSKQEIADTGNEEDTVSSEEESKDVGTVIAADSGSGLSKISLIICLALIIAIPIFTIIIKNRF